MVRHHRLRHGHRQARRALRRPSRPAEEHRGLLPGNRPRRPRRRAGRRLDDLRPAAMSCCSAQRIDESERRRRPESASNRSKLDALLGLCEAAALPAPGAARLLRRGAPSPAATATSASSRRNCGTARVAAQKALSAIFRTGMRFGVAHLIDILRGKATDKIKQWNHDQLPTFGVGSDLDDHAWKSVFRQLAAAGLVHVDMAEHGALQLTDAAREVLKGQRQRAVAPPGQTQGNVIFEKQQRHRPQRPVVSRRSAVPVAARLAQRHGHANRPFPPTSSCTTRPCANSPKCARSATACCPASPAWAAPRSSITARNCWR